MFSRPLKTIIAAAAASFLKFLSFHGDRQFTGTCFLHSRAAKK